MSNCIICKQPVYYWYNDKKIEYKSEKQITCAKCFMNGAKEKENEKELLDLIEHPKYTDKQISAAFRLIEKDKSRQKRPHERTEDNFTLNEEIDSLWNSLK